MSKMIRGLIAAISFFICAAALADAAVYEVSNGHEKLYLAGTIHLLRKQDFPLPPEFDIAYQLSTKIYFETDLQKARSSEFGQRFAQAMLLPSNRTIKDELHPDVWRALQNYADHNQYPLPQTMMYSPALLSILITMHEVKKIGVGDGVDVFYEKAAQNDNKFIGELETCDDVIASMRVFAKEDANKIIKSTLADVASLKGDLEKVIAQWRRGDIDALEKDLADKMRRETPLEYQALIVDRNKKWLPQIEQMLMTPETEMVFVGSLHLSGKFGLVAQLKKSGYSVTPFHIDTTHTSIDNSIIQITKE